MKLVTFNVNGIRAAERRGFRAWLDRVQPDVLALQEVRCPVAALPEHVFDGYHLAYDSGQLAGRNGVALLSRTVPLATRVGLAGDDEFTGDGRYIEADYTVDGTTLTVASLYLPKGAVPSDSPEAKAKFERKMRFCDRLAGHLTAAIERAAATGWPYTLLGDYNIARTPQDLYNNHSKTPLDGYLPEEREWLTAALGLGLTDIVRSLHPDAQGPYSWWSWRGASWQRGYGWRIDYHLTTPGLAPRAVTGDTDRPETYEARVSDHAPVIVEYE
ncbi:MAG: endonuclease/exonuclease/phosphatase family protein [Propionibacteriaceae bacterium]|jgi:exodeoxyribonuclease-3|nr:endonuclease/exonuclease/phosphatase family protein [Propionibacteriaceae bacterium]